MPDTSLPADLLTLLDGSLPASHLHQALRLSSVGSSGWPYAAQLSLGEAVALSPQRLRFALWPGSTTTANLIRDGKMTLALVFDGAVFEIQALAEKREEVITDLQLTVFDAEIRQVIAHRAPYATVTQGVSFVLKDEAAATARWRQQVIELKTLPCG